MHSIKLYLSYGAGGCVCIGAGPGWCVVAIGCTEPFVDVWSTGADEVICCTPLWVDDDDGNVVSVGCKDATPSCGTCDCVATTGIWDWPLPGLTTNEKEKKNLIKIWINQIVFLKYTYHQYLV